MKVLRKWIEDNAVNGSKLRLDNDQYMRSRNAANSGDVNILKVNTLDRIEFASIPQAAGVPASANDLINLAYLQAYANGVRDMKDAVRAASSSQVALTGGAALTIDGVTMINGDRVGLVGQTLPAQNGIYVVSGIGAAYALTRATDADENVEVTQGLSFVAVEGTANGQMQFLLTTQDPIVVGTTALTFVSFPAVATYVGGDMITLTGNVFSVDIATVSGLESSNPGNAAGQLRVKVSAAALVKDRTIKINASNEIEGLKRRKQVFNLIAGDITNGYVDLTEVAADSSIDVHANGSPEQNEGADYTLNYTGGASSKTRVSFAGDLSSLLAAGDVLYVKYLYL